MKLLIGVSHPKHVYIFKNFADKMIERGHDVHIVAVDKEITGYLLKKFGLPHTLIGGNQPNFHRKMMGLLKWEYLTYKIAKEFKPDFFLGRALPHFAHVSYILNKPFIVFEDTELAKTLHKFTLPFADAIVTPNCYKNNNGKKQIRFNGYFELAYLHPNYFKPDISVLDDLGLNRGDKYIIIRLSSWEAYHDNHSEGFSPKLLKDLILQMENYGRVFITSEKKTSEYLERYKLQILPEKLHSALYYANLHFSEGSTAVESALLGTPTVHFEKYSYKADKVVDVTHIHGNYDELVNKYRILNTYANQDQAIEKVFEILNDNDAKSNLKKKKDQILKEKIDVTEFMIKLVEDFP